MSTSARSSKIRAAEAEEYRGKRAHYTGKSDRVIRRQKKALRKLQAQGFHTLPDFFRQKAEEAMQKAKMGAILRLREEEEESSGSESTADKHDSKILEPSYSISAK